ncbi:lipopolysaccharide transport periplasmic protein LptA [Thiohalophilus sp.]|uniref:lipopolysaccharide transport periplasmic protein LptA n=1 Tax=Thiohalophilus sp. TaxID=3028392 RepID=UPI003974B037
MLLLRAKSLLLLVLLGFAPVSVWALSSDREQPVNISADRMRADERHGISHYIGDVFLKQGSLEIRSDELTVHLEDGEVRQIIVIGQPARLQQKPDNREMVYSEARRMEYDTRSGELLLIDEARVTQGANRFSGSRIHYDTRNSIVAANSQGQSSTSPEAPDDGRVKAIIEPADKAGDNAQ